MARFKTNKQTKKKLIKVASKTAESADWHLRLRGAKNLRFHGNWP